MRKFAIFVAAFAVVLSCTEEKAPVDYVDPYIGNVSHLLVPTYPTVHLPNSMLRVYPERGDYTSEYLNGLPILVSGHRRHSVFKLSVTTGEVNGPVVRSSYDNEHIRPYRYDVELEDGAVKVDYAVSHQSAVYRFDSKEPLSVVLASMDGSMAYEDGLLKGSQKVSGETVAYLCMEPESAPESYETLSDGKGERVVMKFNPGTVRMRYGVSFISTDQALANLRREQKGFDVDALASEGRDEWNRALSKIKVSGGSEKDLRVFYTSFYRTYERPVCISEDGRYWSGYDNAVHEDDGTPFYVDDWVWDTYRAAHPLRALLDTEVEEDILASFLRIAEQSGTMWMPTFPGVSGDARSMNCNHGIASFADAVAKGLDVDARKTFEVSFKTLTEKTLAPWSGAARSMVDDFYWEKGYFPALKEGEAETDPVVHPFEKRQPVAVTLGTAYDCWCLSKIAAAAGHPDEERFFAEWSQSYRNIYNSETGFFHPKDSDGNFIPNLDYDFPGGMGAREYYDENNAWEYRWDVQQDIPGLVALMGGDKAFCSELDRMFAKSLGRSKYQFYSKLPDHTGNVGQFSMANEPALHVPYLYNYASEPWKTQKRIRQMLRTWFRDDLMGIPGDEDGGGMTSFVVFSSVGLYPVTPGKAVYDIGSPIFGRSELSLPGGHKFVIEAKGVSEDNKYIQSATLNGSSLNKPWISHEDIESGGRLVLVMGPDPNKEWGIDN